RLYDEVGRYGQEQGWTSPVLSCNDLHEALGAATARVVIYERRQTVLQVRCGMPAGISAVTEAQALAALRYSDFAIMNARPLPDRGDRSPPDYTWPFVKVMNEMRPRLLAECEREFIPLGHFPLFGDDLILYARPAARVSGATADGWVPREGLTVSARAADLRRFPRLELPGEDDFGWLGQAPGVRAELLVSGRPGRAVPARL